MPCMLPTRASDVLHEKRVVKSPDQEKKREKKAMVGIRLALTHDSVVYIGSRYLPLYIYIDIYIHNETLTVY